MADTFKNSIVTLPDGPSSNFSALLNEIGDAKIVLLGESTHGTHEFYKTRAEISKRLIQEKGFTAITIEADWPSAYQINKYVQGYKKISAHESLEEFKRFPTWMWRNKDILEFIQWLHTYNQKKDLQERIGFYGLDIYSLHESAQKVIDYLHLIDKEQAQIARERYSCFEKFGDDLQKYGYFVTNRLAQGCEKDAIDQVKDLLKNKFNYLQHDGVITQEEYFSAHQNSLVVKNAEAYYRLIFSGSYSHSWNHRDMSMMTTLQSLHDHQKKLGKDSKIIVWAHNSHIGDAHFTQFAELGQFNLGQLSREYFGKDAFLVGFTTYEGTVTAASNWGNAAERKIVRAALPDSIERYFHELKSGDFLALLQHNKNKLPKDLIERAIGVLYIPETERASHYFTADVQKQFDAIIHFDKTHAVEPLEKESLWIQGELPETFPSGL